MFLQIGSLIAVGFLWGATNPFIKKGSTGIVHVKEKNKLKKLLLEWMFLFTNYKVLIPILFNQIGSAVYFLSLQMTDLSIAVPVANSLSFVFTALTGSIMGETAPKIREIFGITLILSGTLLCVLAR